MCLLTVACIFHNVNLIFTYRKRVLMKSQEDRNRTARRARGRPRDWDDKTQQNTIKSLDRAMMVLEFLSEAQGRSLSELADDLGQSPATLYRVLVTLEGRGLVEFEAGRQEWNIGAQAFVIGARFLRRTSLVECARPILRRLMERTGETANLGVEKGGLVLFLSQVETHENIRAFFPPGSLSQMHASGIGKALLAEMEPSRLERLLGEQPLVEFTTQTITEHGHLRRELSQIQERGYAIDDEEKNTGMRCIAAPIFDIHQEAVAGLSVSGPTSRMSREKISEIAVAVIEAAAEVSRAIGGQAVKR